MAIKETDLGWYADEAWLTDTSGNIGSIEKLNYVGTWGEGAGEGIQVIAKSGPGTMCNANPAGTTSFWGYSIGTASIVSMGITYNGWVVGMSTDPNSRYWLGENTWQGIQWSLQQFTHHVIIDGVTWYWDAPYSNWGNPEQISSNTLNLDLAARSFATEEDFVRYCINKFGGGTSEQVNFNKTGSGYSVVCMCKWITEYGGDVYCSPVLISTDPNYTLYNRNSSAPSVPTTEHLFHDVTFYMRKAPLDTIDADDTIDSLFPLVDLSGVAQTNETIFLAIAAQSLLGIDGDPYGPGGSSGPGGGDGTHTDVNVPVDFSGGASLGATNTGFITLYNPDISDLQDLASYMWTNPLFDLANWKKIFADPMEAILGLSIVPVDPGSGGYQHVKVGNITTDVTMKIAGSQYVAVDCGTINVTEWWGAYLDYEPYTKAELYLPYCGVHPISIDEIMKGSIQVHYWVDILSGACVAEVKCKDSVLYTFAGQCSASIPITGRDWTNVINGVISVASSVGSMIATGGASAPGSVAGLASTAMNALKPSIEKSGAIGGTAGLMAGQKPVLIITRPNQAKPAKQNEFIGYPSFITRTLADVEGYCEVEEVHLENIPATGDELSEIERLLKEGVIF